MDYAKTENDMNEIAKNTAIIIGVSISIFLLITFAIFLGCCLSGYVLHQFGI